VKKKAFNRHR